MNAAEVIARMTAMATSTKDDALSNALLRVAHRLAHQGYPFEKPLTKAETRIVMKFVEG